MIQPVGVGLRTNSEFERKQDIRFHLQDLSLVVAIISRENDVFHPWGIDFLEFGRHKQSRRSQKLEDLEGNVLFFRKIQVHIVDCQVVGVPLEQELVGELLHPLEEHCLLYTSDAADIYSV